MRNPTEGVIKSIKSTYGAQDKTFPRFQCKAINLQRFKKENKMK